ncbi:hypothetical protein F8M41_008257 [Gigaspora margarita]|uniref:Uncharacterized protein n=1 Tax=Gigaspora margarita TaxID=4874 RepID=A0A8H4ER00_GIGMA|nr:hypothetical protein F8M41_008257 [Gigaspora margarita]
MLCSKISYSIADACLPFKTEKKTRAVVNFWYDIQQSIAVRHTSLGHLSAFGASINEGVKLPARRQREDITDTCEAIIMNIKKSRVDGQDSQLDNDNEQSSANIQDSRLANYSKQSPSASAFSDHVNLEDETNCTTDNNKCEQTTKWEVGGVNVSNRFRQYQKQVFKKAEKGSLKHANIYELFALLGMPIPHLYNLRMERDNKH